MEKKLPKVYANKIDKDVKNNKRVYYSSFDEKKEDVRSATTVDINRPNLDGKTVPQKLYAIFHGPNYVYKADVTLRIKGRNINKKIIGYNAQNIITVDNDVIPIADIEDIYFSS